MCSHNIGPYVNVWQLVSHLDIVTFLITLYRKHFQYNKNINKHTFFLINKALLLCKFTSKVNKIMNNQIVLNLFNI